MEVSLTIEERILIVIRRLERAIEIAKYSPSPSEKRLLELRALVEGALRALPTDADFQRRYHVEIFDFSAKAWVILRDTLSMEALEFATDADARAFVAAKHRDLNPTDYRVVLRPM